MGEDDYAAAAAVLSDEQVSAVAWLATVMNAFNRVAITSRYAVSGPLRTAAAHADEPARLAAG